jgi:hypothetical protein
MDRSLRDEGIEAEPVELECLKGVKRRRQQRFVLVPWGQLAAQMKALRVSPSGRLLMVLHLQKNLDATRADDGWIVPRNSILAEVDLAHRNFSRVLAQLEAAGLIEVQRRPGKRSKVRLVDA